MKSATMTFHEEVITSGRMNPEIDPVLTVWGWEIPLYLYLGGLVAGILFFSAYYVIRHREDEYPTAVKMAPMWAPPLIVIGLVALLLDLSHWRYFWRLYTTIHLESPMSWGAWTLGIITPLSFLWAAVWLEDAFPRFSWPFLWMKGVINTIHYFRIALAWLILVLAVLLGVYTGILLSAFNARPFWNSGILGPLFLVSGLSTGTAMVMLLAGSHHEREHFSRIDLMLIGIELFMIVHLFMGFLSSTEVHVEAAKLFLGGPYTAPFWVLVVGLGLVVPALIELLGVARQKVPVQVPAALVLVGGLVLRFIVLDAGLGSRWLY
jgi:formate-dependent nitrite reductase membrane component NrfD